MRFSELLRIMGRLLGYLRPYWAVVLAAFLATIVLTLARLSQAKFVGFLFGLMADAFTAPGHSPFATLNLICVAFLGMMAILGLATYCQRYWVELSGQAAIRDLRDELFRKLQSLSLGFYDSMRLGEIHSRASNDIHASANAYVALSDFLKNSLLLAGALGWMFWMDWQMTVLVLVMSPTIAMAVSRFGQKMGRRTRHLQEQLADLSAILYESISSIKAVQAYTREGHEVRRFSAKNESNFAAQMKLVQVLATQTPVVEFLGAVGIVTIVWFGATRILQGLVTFQQMTEFWTLMVLTTHPIKALSDFYSMCQTSGAAGKRVFEILDRRPDVVEAPDAVDLPPLQGRVEFRGVWFGYGDEPVLKGVNLTVEPGEVVAIVGPNGAGKTSLVNLVPRFYDVDEGAVLVDGHDVRRATLRSLRSQVAMVIQESILFAGTVADNITCGADFPRERVEEAARIANAHEFICRLPEGYDTEIGERGVRLSGGQRQRLAIARALLRDPRILILDECTSGIDAESENLITEAIDRAMAGRTCLVIAHRLNTIRHARKIVVLEGGRVAEMGSHEDLLARGGLYSRLCTAQLRPPGDNGAAAPLLRQEVEA